MNEKENIQTESAFEIEEFSDSQLGNVHGGRGNNLWGRKPKQKTPAPVVSQPLVITKREVWDQASQSFIDIDERDRQNARLARNGEVIHASIDAPLDTSRVSYADYGSDGIPMFSDD